MLKPTKKFLRIAAASVCAISLSIWLEEPRPRSSPPPEPDHPQHTLSQAHLMVLSLYLPSTNYWPHR